MSEIKTEINNLYRQEESGGLINKNLSGLAAYKSQKKKFNEMKSFGDRLNKLEAEIQELKALVLRIVDDEI